MIESFTVVTFLFIFVLTVFYNVAFIIAYGTNSVRIRFVFIQAIFGLMALVAAYVTGINICIVAISFTATLIK
jgi:hypothetical protein